MSLRAGPARASRPWPNFLLTWLSSDSRPGKYIQRKTDEHIAGLGMIQANQLRAEQNLPIFVFGTILTGIHDSPSDPDAHVTISAATEEMRERNQHITIHSRVRRAMLAPGDPQWAYIGSRAYLENIKNDSELLRKSYQKPIRTQSSLAEVTKGVMPVGCIVNEGEQPRWYVISEHGPVFLEEDKFFSVGTGEDEHLEFWDPVNERLSRAQFTSMHRPRAHSPPPQVSYLEGAVSGLSLETAEGSSAPAPAADDGQEEDNSGDPCYVVPYAKNGKIRFHLPNNRVVQREWSEWGSTRSQDGQAIFQFQGKKRIYYAAQLPGEWVEESWRDERSSRPLQFRRSDGSVVKTRDEGWAWSRDGSFLFYRDSDVVYMMWAPPREEAGGLGGGSAAT